MNTLIYKNETTLFSILVVIACLFWLGLVLATVGIALVYLLFFYVFYLFAQSALISHLKGTGVKITATQFPDLHSRILECSGKLGVDPVPEAYILHAGGAFNAFATRFLGRNFIVLYSDVADALDEHPDALNFYIGHELGHLKRKHLRWGPLLAPATLLPLAGAAYFRAREYTCDRHGLAVCPDVASAQLGLGALAAGGKRWRTLNRPDYMAQSADSGGFWMSLHEYLSDYPWLVKRMGALEAVAAGREPQPPKRHPLAGVLALFIPRFGMVGGAGSMLVVIAVIGILAAIAIPQYAEYTNRAKMKQAVTIGRQATEAVSSYFDTHGNAPPNLAEAGFAAKEAEGIVKEVTVHPRSGVVTVVVAIGSHAGKSILFVPSVDAGQRLTWRCGSEDIPASALPTDCRN